MEFDQLMARLEELRLEAERERFIQAAHQLEAVAGFMRWRARIFSVREPEIWSGETPSDNP